MQQNGRCIHFIALATFCNRISDQRSKAREGVNEPLTPSVGVFNLIVVSRLQSEGSTVWLIGRTNKLSTEISISGYFLITRWVL